MTSKQKGNITELECMTAVVRLGYNVLTPYGDCERYDFVIDINGIFYKIQCKTSRTEDNGASFIFSCRSNHRKNGKIVHHKYTSDEIDFFITYFDGQCYLIPIEDCGGTKHLRILEAKNDQERGIAWAKDYLLETVIKKIS
jgi:hypothetical protein